MSTAPLAPGAFSCNTTVYAVDRSPLTPEAAGRGPSQAHPLAAAILCEFPHLKSRPKPGKMRRVCGEAHTGYHALKGYLRLLCRECVP